MYSKLKKVRLICAMTALIALTALVGASAASAHSGTYAEFNYCPSTTSGVESCLYSKVTSGEVVLGKKKVPIVNPVILQGGVTGAAANGFQGFVAATNGETLSKSPQPVPGGLSGLVNCKEITNPLFYFLRVSCEAVFENGLTGVNSTVELAKPASSISVSEGNLLFQTGVGLSLPVRVHLENPLLGSSCYIGSSSSPLTWNLTTGSTAPPAPNTSIKGTRGTVEFVGEDQAIERLNGIKLVDNAWSAPGASGCGGSLGEFILDPIINASVGVPSAAGKNTAILTGVADDAEAAVVNQH
jgi:hypothetical protein